MKKITLLFCTIGTAFLLTGCGKVLNVTYKLADNGFNVPVSGTSSEKYIYWKTDANGTNKVKTKNGKFEFTIPVEANRFTAEVSNSKNMSDSKDIKIKKTQRLNYYSTFLDDYENFDGDKNNSLPETPINNKNYAKNSDDNALLLNVDDGELLGINIYAEHSTNVSWFVKEVSAVGESLTANESTLENAINTAIKKPDQYITKKSGGISYTFKINKNKENYQMFVHM